MRVSGCVDFLAFHTLVFFLLVVAVVAVEFEMCVMCTNFENCRCMTNTLCVGSGMRFSFICTIFHFQCNLSIHCDDSEDNDAVDCVKTK